MTPAWGILLLAAVGRKASQYTFDSAEEGEVENGNRPTLKHGISALLALLSVHCTYMLSFGGGGAELPIGYLGLES